MGCGIRGCIGRPAAKRHRGVTPCHPTTVSPALSRGPAVFRQRPFKVRTAEKKRTPGQARGGGEKKVKNGWEVDSSLKAEKRRDIDYLTRNI